MNNIHSYIETLKQYKWQIGLPAVAIVIVTSFLLVNQVAPAADQTNLANLSLTEQTQSSSASSESSKPSSSQESSQLVVDVKGAVKNPGLYTLDNGSRVNDAVMAAGGLTTEADPKSINLAQKITDEAVVYVAHRDEQISVVPSNNTSSAISQNQDKTEAGLVNLNTATEADLQTISGVGAKRAADIIAYREANGGFKTVDDLNNVSGIGDKTLESIRPYVTVD